MSIMSIPIGWPAIVVHVEDEVAFRNQLPRRQRHAPTARAHGTRPQRVVYFTLLHFAYYLYNATANHSNAADPLRRNAILHTGTPKSN